MKNSLIQWAFALVCLLILAVSCGKENEKPVAPEFVFKHNINGYELQKGVMNYTNQAGNLYQVDELQYFISEITLKTADDKIYPITTDNAIHYIDLDIPSTLNWKATDRLPVADYTSITFVFGINEAKNKTGLFVNPPERDMFWPDMMGGGYHYMKMNGQWKSSGDTIKAFNLHLGIGMNEDGTIFYQNYFSVTLPLNIHTGTLSNVFTITMNIEKWFEAPNVWDWNITGGQIMQNQDAMHKACENGANAFQITHEGKDIVYHN
jgi:hypothetical protein